MLCLTALPWPACADDLEEYNLARSRYDAGQFADAAAKYAQLLDEGNPSYIRDLSIRQMAKKDYAATLIALGTQQSDPNRLAEADRIIEQILRSEPNYQPRPGDYPQVVIDRYIHVGRRIGPPLKPPVNPEEINELQQRIEELERLNAELQEILAQETVVEDHSRLIAMLPFGIGQFQNGNHGLGWFFAVSQVLTMGTAAVTGIIAQDLGSVDCREPDPDGNTIDCEGLEDSFMIARGLNWGFVIGTGVLAVAGITEAQISFIPESRSTRRKPQVEIKPAAVVNEQSLMLGMEGRF